LFLCISSTFFSFHSLPSFLPSVFPPCLRSAGVISHANRLIHESGGTASTQRQLAHYSKHTF
jgi:hypothetical protein